MLVTVVIDVFRAFTTASYVLENHPATYKLAVNHAVISRLAQEHINPVVIGKPERGVIGNIYHIPNSPTRVMDVQIGARDVIHRTEAGARGILLAKESDVVLAAGFVNARATVNYIKSLIDPQVKIVPMGHEGVTPSLEDDLCARYIQGLIDGEEIEPAPYFSQLKMGSGSYFFSEDQQQYPREDFDRCLEIDRFNFAILAEVKGEYAILSRC